MKTTSFLHNLWLGLYKVYLETIFPLCREKWSESQKQESPTVLIELADRELLCVLHNPHTAGLKMQ